MTPPPSLLLPFNRVRGDLVVVAVWDARRALSLNRTVSEERLLEHAEAALDKWEAEQPPVG